MTTETIDRAPPARTSGAGQPPAISRGTLAALAGLCAFLVAAFNPSAMGANDTWWHLAAGAWMFAHHAVPHVDPFSYTFAGHPWVAHEWGSEILMRLAYDADGWAGVTLLFAFAVAASFAILAWSLRDHVNTLASLLLALTAFCCVRPALVARPHVLAMIPLVIWTAEHVAARAARRAPSWRLVPLMVVWANLHGSFLFGLALTGALGFEALIEETDRRAQLVAWGAFGIAALLAALITPHGVEGLLFPIQLTSMASLGAIAEWAPTSFDSIQPLEVAILALLYLGLGRGARVPPWRLLMLMGFIHLALHHARHQSLIGLVVIPLIAPALGRSLPMTFTPPLATRPNRIVLALILIAAGIRAAIPVDRANDADTPRAALEAVPASLRAEPVLNDYAFGGYLIFEGVRPFIDGRADLYGDAFLTAYLKMIRPDPFAVQAALERYHIEWTLLDPANRVVAVLDLLPGWHRLYADDTAIVHVRDPAP